MLMTILFALLGLVSALPMAMTLDRMPAACFCDYDETPGAQHLAPRTTRNQRIVCGLILAAAFALVYARFGISVKGISLCLFCVILTMIALSDLRFCIIPDELLIAGCVLAVISGVPDIINGYGLFEKLSPALGGIIGAGIILAINLLGRLMYRKDALGMGDLKLMAVCGIACGAVGIVIAILMGILAAGIWFALGIALKRVRSDEYLPLGPFLVFGTAATICFRPAIDALLAWYISLI